MKTTKLDDLMKHHQHELTPNKDLWRGIDIALEHKKRPVRFYRSSKWLALAATLVLSVVVLYQVPLGERLINNESSLSEQLIAQHVQQRELLVVTYQQAGYNVVTPEIEPELMRLREATRSLQDALAKSPNDTGLLEMLNWVQQQELALLMGSYEAQRRQHGGEE